MRPSPGLARRAALFAQLAGLQGRFLLSFDDVPEIWRLAARHGFTVRETEVSYSLGAQVKARKKSPELLVGNAL